MLKISYSRLTLSLLVLFSIKTFATGYSMEGKITGMFTGEGNTFGVFHSGNLYNPGKCPNARADNAYLIEYDSQKDWSSVRSMLLTAYVSEKNIRIGVSATKCYFGYPVIERVAFVKGY